MEQKASLIHARDAYRTEIYRPEVRPGFTAWVTGFDYGDGRIGLSFKETRRQHNPAYRPPRLAMGEATGAPVSYCSVECGSAQETSYRVYMASIDGAKTFYETGRCLLEDGSFCNIGFPDGRIVGLDVPRINEARTGWCDGIRVRESTDGGSTWHDTAHLLPGTAPYLWRVRRLRDGTIVVLACLYGTLWGEGQARATRNTMLPGETYLHKIQTFFMTTRDGVHFTGPHYILPGTGAHEYDMVERADGALLFIAGDVQATPVARQVVHRDGDRFINGTLYGIRRGAPPDPARNPQGGFVPETMVMLPDGLIVGARRGKPYSCSVDEGENWFEIDGVPESLYQPFMMHLPDGSIANFGHFGGDNAFGQVDMYIGGDFFTAESRLPSPAKLTLIRCLSPDGSHYENRYEAYLTADGQPVPGMQIDFRFTPVWNADGTVNTTLQENAPIRHSALTDAQGCARVHAHAFDAAADIHLYYNVDAVFRPGEDSGYFPCDGPMMCCAALTPHRQCLFPHDAYFANGVLYLSPDLLAAYPDACAQLPAHTCADGTSLDAASLPAGLAARLLAAHVLTETADGHLLWRPSVHCPRPLADVRRMESGDWYE